MEKSINNIQGYSVCKVGDKYSIICNDVTYGDYDQVYCIGDTNISLGEDDGTVDIFVGSLLVDSCEFDTMKIADCIYRHYEKIHNGLCKNGHMFIDSKGNGLVKEYYGLRLSVEDYEYVGIEYEVVQLSVMLPKKECYSGLYNIVLGEWESPLSKGEMEYLGHSLLGVKREGLILYNWDSGCYKEAMQLDADEDYEVLSEALVRRGRKIYNIQKKESVVESNLALAYMLKASDKWFGCVYEDINTGRFEIISVYGNGDVEYQGITLSRSELQDLEVNNLMVLGEVEVFKLDSDK